MTETTRIPCSVPILTLNSKENLQILLPLSVKNFEDVFLIDGNSTDGTQEYAKSLGVRVEKQSDSEEPNLRIADFRQARLRSWKMCKFPWVFYLDSDQIPTQEAVELIRRIVHENEIKQVHQLKRYPRLSDGRVIRNTPFYGYYVALFNLDSDVTLADRKVHERFVVPADVKTINHDEAIICPEPNPQAMRMRSRGYIRAENESLSSVSVVYLFKWILWFNARSFFGQFYRVVKTDIENHLAGQPSLPWSYNLVFLEYRWLSMTSNFHTWLKNRKRNNKVIGLD
ncbi:MAG: hypothetical protein ABII13_02110 [Patescibacteria group bacterium]|nr:hypothetical protein [Patescibacteria group bacterium]